MRKIAVFTGTRAEYGLLYPLMCKIDAADDMTLQVIAGAAHMLVGHGATWREIEADGFSIDARVDMLLASDTPTGVTKSVGVGLIGLADALERLQPDLLVLLGDRFEALAAAQAAMLFRIPIAHIHGGETTEGAVDEAIRHAITKMAHVHFVAADDYRRRVIQLGENPGSVHLVGAPGLDNIDSLQPVSKSDLEKDLGLTFNHPLLLVTYHPVTLDPCALGSLDNLLAVLDQHPEATVIITGSNADMDGSAIDRQVRDWCSANAERARHFPSLGFRRYLSLMRLSDAVVGNSSSGLLEAPVLGVPTVNIGSRQQGRLRAESVIDCGDSFAEIDGALKKALSREHRAIAEARRSPYGSPGAAGRMMKVLSSTKLDGILVKKFYDL